MTDRQKLAACPFCGKQPLGPLDTSYGYWRITCGDANECTVQPVADGDTEAEAITAWNTRTPQAGDAEQVREAAAKLVEGWEGDLDYTDDLAAAIRAMPLPTTTDNETEARSAA